MPPKAEVSSQNRLAISINPYILLYGLVLFFFWIYTGLTTTNFTIWLLENTLTIPAIILIYFSYRWHNLSTLSLTYLFLFLMLHLYGSHHTYTKNPFGFWLQQSFQLSRNHFDRLVHFSFGLFISYPLHEITRDKFRLPGWLTYVIPVELMLSAGALYELVEWLVATTFMRKTSTAFLGMQGDIWDAQKDVALAVLGSIIMLGINLVFQKQKRNPL